MPALWSRGLAAGLALVLALAEPAWSRPFGVEDLLAQEGLGAAAFDPSGRWLLFERRGPYASAPRFDQDQDNATATSRIWRVDVAGSGSAKPLLDEAEPPGQLLGDPSPDGSRIAVYRLHAGQWRLGVATLATGAVRWFELTPEISLYGRAFQWLSDDSFVVLTRPEGTLPWLLRLGRLSADLLPDLWARAAAGAAAVTVVGSGAHLGARDRPPPGRLVRVDLATGLETPLGDGAFTDLEVSPDRRHIALRVAAEDLQPKAGQPVQGAWGLALQAERLELLDLETGWRRTPCASCDLLPHVFTWSANSQHLLVYTRRSGEPWTAGQLEVVDVRTGSLRPVGEDVAPVIGWRPEVVRADWMGEAPIVWARPVGQPQAPPAWWRLGPRGPRNLAASLPEGTASLAVRTAHALVFVGPKGAWRVDRLGQAAKLADGALTLARRPRLGRDGRLFEVAGDMGWATRAEPGGRRQLVRLTADEAVEGPILPAGSSLAALPSSTGHAAWREADDFGVEHLVLRSSKGERVAAVLNARLTDVDGPRVQVVRHEGPDRRPLSSWLFLPTAPTAQPPPLVVKVYAGATYRSPPGAADGLLGFPADIRLLVGHGYAVLVPSLPTLTPGEPASGLGKQIVDVVAAAAAEPRAANAFDTDRVALWGHSFGGYTVMAALTQTGRFRAAVAISGFSDFTAKWAGMPTPHRALQPEGVRSNFATGSVEVGQSGLGGPPWRDPLRYQRNSPLLAADKIVTPLFLAHGDQDGGVALAQSEAMFSALYRQGKDAELATYWGEGHYISSPGNVRDLYARAFAFLDQHLAASGAAPPARLAPAPASAAPTPRPPPRKAPRAAEARR